MPTLAPGLETPPLILGGNVFGWTIDEAASFAVLDAFVEAGGRMIDTANSYSAWVSGNRGGESETIIGRWLKRRGAAGDVAITTKMGMFNEEGLSSSRIRAACDESLARLGVERIDLYLAHQDDPATSQEAVAEAFAGLIAAGKIRAAGASNFTAERLAGALDAGAPFSVLQPYYNLLERDRFEGTLQELCVERNVAATPYYGLASGYLTGKYRRPEDLAGSARGGSVRRYVEGNGPAVLAALDAVAEEHRVRPAAVALAWLAHQPGVAAPIASATSPAQLADLVPAMTLHLTPEQLDRLDEAST